MIWIPDGGFWIDRYPVTNAEYLQFVATAPRSDKKLYEADHRLADPVFANHPATQVSWYGAAAYATWRSARLPTVVEWQTAARLAGAGNVDTEGSTPVDQFGNAGASVYGCRDMVGNVGEWTSTDWDTTSDQGWVFAWIDGQKIFEIPIKVLCGGSWFDTADSVHPGVTTRHFTPIRGSSGVGFRCVR